MGFLLDTCSLIYVTAKARLREEARGEIEQAFNRNLIHVSPASALEIGRLAASGRFASPIAPLQYFEGFCAKPGVSVLELSAEILVASSFIPPWRHKDPIDRILVAAARLHDMTLVTSDRAILAYGAEGHVKTLAC